jgi:hypothetical protein
MTANQASPSTPHADPIGNIITPYFQFALIFAIEGLDVNDPPPTLVPKSAILVLFFNPALASIKDVEADTDSRGPGLVFRMGLLRGNIDSLFFG